VKVAHVTTVDMSLRFLVLAQLRSVLELGGEAIGISAPGPWVRDLEALGIRHLPLSTSTRGMNLWADFRAALDLWRIIRREKPDVLHTHNPKPGLYGRVLGRLAGLPIVVNTVHGLYATEDDPVRKRVMVYALEAVAARFSDAELVQSAEDYALLTRWRISPPGKTWLLGNGIDLTRFNPARVGEQRRREIRAELGIDPDQIAVGAVGRLVEEKGYPEFFEAAKLLGGRFVALVIGPEDREKADALGEDVIKGAQRMGVRFLGMRDDIDQLYRALDLFVLPSHREGFPRAAMEAAAMGLPVIATNIRGCREVVEHGSNGLLVPVRSPEALAAAIQMLGDDPNLRRAMGKAGYRRARHQFDERAVVATVLGTYARVARRKGLNRPL
jgi:glycosyltransferase involved in cell wall biosynthesis